MMVVISSPDSCPVEVKAVKALLTEGLEIFHVRKPNWSVDQVRNFLQEFTADERNLMVIHKAPELVLPLEIKGYHFSSEELKRPDNVQILCESLAKQNKTVSASFHQLRQAEEYPVLFDYVFLSPVFDSISKAGYLKNASLQSVKDGKRQNYIALGGIDASNISSLRDSGYNGFAVLGALWQEFDGDTEQLKRKFKVLKQLAPGTERSRNGKGQTLSSDNSRF